MIGRNDCLKVITFVIVTLCTLFLFGSLVYAIDYPDMPVVNDATCWNCHPNFVSVVDGPYSITPILGGQHTPYTACYNCHTTKIWGSPRFNACTYCHFDNYPSGYPKYMSYRHTSDGASSFGNIVNRRHPISNIHQSSTTGCDSCHSIILTDEHNRADRTDNNGNRINCNTCHAAVHLGSQVSTEQSLKIIKTQDYQIQYSNPWYPPTGTKVSRVYIETILDSSSYMELYAWYNGRWGLVYGRANGQVAKWLDLPAPTTALRTKIQSPSATTLPNSYLDVPKVTLSPSGDEFNMIQTAINNHNTSCGACHENAGHKVQHNSTLTTNCQSCHQSNLLDEHQSRQDDAGNYLSCQTCHQSQDPLVVMAIAGQNKNCEACHPQVNHEAFHVSQLNSACQTCHNSSISDEHLNNPTTQGLNYTCNTCHDNTGTAVNRTIKADNLRCSGCHNQGHNLTFVEEPPIDIPLFDSFAWSDPIEAGIFIQEPSTPLGYESGQVVISNRRADIAIQDVWNFYDSNLIANGWARKSGQYVTGSQFFEAEYVKNVRVVFVRCYNTVSGNGTGATVSGGFRIEIWYNGLRY